MVQRVTMVGRTCAGAQGLRAAAWCACKQPVQVLLLEAYEQLEADVGQEVDRALGRQAEEMARLSRRVQFLEGHLETEKKQVEVLGDEAARLEEQLGDANARMAQYESGVCGLPQVRVRGGDWLTLQPLELARQSATVAALVRECHGCAMLGALCAGCVGDPAAQEHSGGWRKQDQRAGAAGALDATAQGLAAGWPPPVILHATCQDVQWWSQHKTGCTSKARRHARTYCMHGWVYMLHCAGEQVVRSTGGLVR